MSLENWMAVYEQLDNIICTYTKTDTITSHKTYSLRAIQDWKLKYTISWINMNSQCGINLQQILNGDETSTAKHFLNIKFEKKSTSKFEKHVKMLNDKIRQLERGGSKIKNQTDSNNATFSTSNKIMLAPVKESLIKKLVKPNCLEVDVKEKSILNPDSDEHIDLKQLPSIKQELSELTPLDEHLTSTHEEYIPANLATSDIAATYMPSKIEYNAVHQEYSPTPFPFTNHNTVTYTPGVKPKIHELSIEPDIKSTSSIPTTQIETTSKTEHTGDSLQDFGKSSKTRPYFGSMSKMKNKRSYKQQCDSESSVDELKCKRSKGDDEYAVKTKTKKRNQIELFGTNSDSENETELGKQLNIEVENIVKSPRDHLIRSLKKSHNVRDKE